MEKITTWIKEHKVETIVLAVILVFGAFLRLYKIGAYMTFLGDEGRDAILVWRLLTKADIILIGPGTSIGNMYLGPLYYYFIAPALFLAGYNPIGPSVLVALTGIATIFLVWFTAREWFGTTAAYVASMLYAVAPTVIVYSRSSWNPNIMPFFSLVCMYALWRVWKKNEYMWLVVIGFSFAFVLQSHYLGLLMFPVLGLFVLLTFLKGRVRQDWLVDNGRFARGLFIGAFVFLFLMSPLAIFDLRHNFINTKAIFTFFSQRQTTVSARPWTALPQMPQMIQKITTRLLGARIPLAGDLLLAFLSIPSLLLLLGRKNVKQNEPGAWALLFVWLATAFIGLGVYKQEIYDHYYGFFFTAPFLVIGGFYEGVFSNLSKYGKIVMASAFVVLLGVNIYQTPLKNPPTYQMQRAMSVANRIEELAHGDPLNLAVIAERNYEDGYEYFLLKDKTVVVDIDPNNTESTITDQLYVVCEKPQELCDPTHSEKAEVANWGWSKIAHQEEIMGITLFKLVHSQK